MDKLKYKDEADRAYGLVGMAVSLLVWDADEMLESLDLDAPVNGGIRFTPDFYFRGSPAFSAKASWERQVEQFRLKTAMLLANVACRRFVHDSARFDSELRDKLLNLVCEEGEASCSLDKDESSAVFRKCYSYCEQIFTHSGVKQVAHDSVRSLTSKRVLHRSDLMELLAPISRM